MERRLAKFVGHGHARVFSTCARSMKLTHAMRASISLFRLVDCNQHSRIDCIRFRRSDGDCVCGAGGAGAQRWPRWAYGACFAPRPLPYMTGEGEERTFILFSGRDLWRNGAFTYGGLLDRTKRL